MKSARILICLLALAWWSAAAPAPSTRTQRPGKSLIGGRTHTDLTAWAAANGFTARWNSRAGELRLTNRWAKLFFNNKGVVDEYRRPKQAVETLRTVFSPVTGRT